MSESAKIHPGTICQGSGLPWRPRYGRPTCSACGLIWYALGKKRRPAYRSKVPVHEMPVI